jgi:arginine exporter protein ArgO
MCTFSCIHRPHSFRAVQGISKRVFTYLGVFGVHRFYLNKPWTGLLYLLTGGVFLIGWLIDLFLIPDMVEVSLMIHPAVGVRNLFICG